jgi:hypothetical protein
MESLSMFGLIDKNKCMLKLDSDIYVLKKSVFGYLYNNVYRHRYSADESALWAMSVLNTLLLVAPDSEQAVSFYGKNEDKIWLESLQVKIYPELSGASGGASYLYFAEMCSVTDIMNEPSASQSIHDIMHKSLTQTMLDDDLSRRQLKMGRHNIRYIDLRDRSEQLGIFVPSIKNVCKGNNVFDIIDSIRSFTNIFLKHRID